MGLILLRTIWLISLLCITFLLILSSCHNDTTIEMNEISLNKLEDKIEEDQSFLLVTFSADEKDVQESDLVEALEEVFAHNDKVAFFISANKDAHDEENLNQLGKEHTSTSDTEKHWQPMKNAQEGETQKQLGKEKTSLSDTEKPWEPMKNAIVLIHLGEVIKQTPTNLLIPSNIHMLANKHPGEKNSFYESTKNFDSEIT